MEEKGTIEQSISSHQDHNTSIDDSEEVDVDNFIPRHEDVLNTGRATTRSDMKESQIAPPGGGTSSEASKSESGSSAASSLASNDPPTTTALTQAWTASSIGSVNGVLAATPPALERSRNFTHPGAFRMEGPNQSIGNDDDDHYVQGNRTPSTSLTPSATYLISPTAPTNNANPTQHLNFNNSNSSELLVEASLVEESPPEVETVPSVHLSEPQTMTTRTTTVMPVLVHAKPLEESPPTSSSSSNRSSSQARRRRCYVWTILALVVAAISVGVSLGVTLSVSSSNSDKTGDTNASPPTAAPTWSPTTQQLMTEFRSTLPDYAQSALSPTTSVTSSPQYQAYQWLGSTPLELLSNYSAMRMTQRYALATLYYATNGKDWIRNDGWLSWEHECMWYTDLYVESACDKDRESVVRLRFTDNRLNGTIPSEIGLLAPLEFLAFQVNSFLDGSIPETISNASPTLVRLLFDGNDFSGPIPTFVTTMSLLEHLELSNNRLSGTIPTDLSKLTKLKRFAVGNNNLTGTVPPSLKDLSNLSILDLSENQLQGVIPTQLGSLSLLEYLAINNNRLQGKIPSLLGDVTPLRSIFAENNLLTGTIPPQLGKLTDLRYLLLDSNYLKGTSPQELCSLITDNQLVVALDCNLVQCDCGCLCGEDSFDDGEVAYDDYLDDDDGTADDDDGANDDATNT